MPIAIADLDAYLATVDRLSNPMEARWGRRMATIMQTFWKRAGAYATNPGIIDIAYRESRAATRTLLTGLYRESTNAWVAMAATAGVAAVEAQDAAAEARMNAWAGIELKEGTLGRARRLKAERELAQLLENAVAEWIRVHALERSTMINASMLERARAIIARGVEQGLSNEEIGRQLAERSVSRRRARALGIDPATHGTTIARTEIASARNAVNALTVAELRQRAGLIIDYKTWVHVGDDKVRFSHKTVRPLDGGWYNSARSMATVRYDDQFNVGGEVAHGPHDGRLSVWNVANCRCGLIYNRDLPDGLVAQ